MKTFSLIVKTRKKLLIKGLTNEESKWILQSLVNITLNYKLTRNMGMYYHCFN